MRPGTHSREYGDVNPFCTQIFSTYSITMEGGESQPLAREFNVDSVPVLVPFRGKLIGNGCVRLEYDYEGLTSISDAVSVEYSLNGGPPTRASYVDYNIEYGETFSIAIVGLKNNRTYQIRARIVYDTVVGAWSAETAIVPTAKGVPKCSIKAGNGSAVLKYKIPKPIITGSIQILGGMYVYGSNGEYRSIQDNVSQSLTGTLEISGLTNGVTYTALVIGFYIVSYGNDTGPGAFTTLAQLRFTPQGPPSAPRPTSETAPLVNGQATIPFNLPVTNGGSKITRYTYSVNGSAYKPIALQRRTTLPTVIIKGVKEGDMITLKAVNARGASVASDPVLIPVSMGF